MKLKNRILSLAMVLLLAFNGYPSVLAARNDTLTLVGDITSAITNVEYGSTAATYRFADGCLVGAEAGDEVYLAADASYDSTEIGSANVTLTNFRLEGAQAAYYTVPAINEPVEKQIQIIQRTIKIVPAHPYKYFGQEKPRTITKIADYASQIVPGEVVRISAKFDIESGNDVGNYSMQIVEPISKSGADSENYNVILDPDAKFSVRAYKPTETAEAATNDYAGVATATLTAPAGFQISQSNNGGWGNTITVDLSETQFGSAVYFLKNNDPSDNEYFEAISTQKTYHYTSVQTLPTIETIRIEKANANEKSKLNFLPFGVFGNDSVNITVTAVGTTVKQETTIYCGEEGNYASKTATSERKGDGKYYYTAVFSYTVPVGEQFTKTQNLQAYAVNSSGTGSKSAELTGRDADGNNKTVDSKPFMLENIKPDINAEDIQSNKWRNSINISIADADSGIAKVEYGWDLDRSLCDDNKNVWTGHYLGFSQNGFTNQYIEYPFDNTHIVNNMDVTLELKFPDAVWVNGNKHTLYIKVTDNAGNRCEEIIRDPVGSDMDAPNITGVEIRKAPAGTLDSILRFITFGTFSNNSVEIAVSADDNEAAADTFASGVKSVTLNGRTMTKNDAGEYVLTVSPDDMLNVMSITAEDNKGWTTTAAVTDIPDGTGFIKSSDLIVENDDPTINFEFSSSGHTDSSGKAWYGAGDTLETLIITAADNQGSVKSGLYSVKITDNSIVRFSKTGFSAIEYELNETYVIGDLTDGEHIISVFVEDNAGNTFSDSRTFYIDCNPPESGTITAITPASTVIDGKQWFDKNDVITFRIDSADADSGLGRIALNMNGKEFNFANDEILSDAAGYYVTIDTTNLNPDAEHKYTVTGTAVDVAGNTLTLAPLTVYKDLENPAISKFTVEKKNSALDKILHVLTFGAYSNNALIFKAHVSDTEFDSGVDYATVLYSGLSSPQNMTDEGNGVFSVEIPVGAEVFQSDIIVTAYDKYGKSSVSCPNLEDAETGDLSNGKFVLIETIQPAITLSLPAGDGAARADGQTWYNSNKPIELKAQDENSGIRNIDFKVNGIEVSSDKDGGKLLKTAATEAAAARNTEEQSYSFDTDFFTYITREPDDGKYTVEIEVTDNAGNITACETIYYIDKVGPAIERVDFTPATSDRIENTSEFIEQLDYGFYFKTDFIATVNVSDEFPSSGLNEVKYRFVPYENGEKQPEIIGSEKIEDGQAKLSVPKGFKGQIFVEAFDNVINRSGEKTTKAYVVDSAPPEIRVIKNVSTTFHDAAGNNLYVENNSITVVVTDMGSGIKEIGYSQSAENDSYGRKIISIGNKGYEAGASLSDGWTVSSVDVNHVTQITKTFIFSSDDNDVLLTFDAIDNSLNKTLNVQSEKFTIDKTEPIINVAFRADKGDSVYYNQNRIADITVIDRNFDADLMKVLIQNTFGSVPTFSFSEESKTRHTAVIDFDEGDYTFDVSGTDLGNHSATVNFSGGNEKLFYVDKTKPSIEENFTEFEKSNPSFGDENNSFNSDKTVNIKVTEHNFDPALVNLRITRKDAGAAHSASGLIDVTSEVLGGAKWVDSGDVHTITFTFSRDAVYQVEITPTDLAGNAADHRNTAVFEIDKTVPVVSAKNGAWVADNDVEFLDIYPYSRKDDPSPTVEFDDLNIDHINYVLTVYIPDHTSPDAVTVIRPVKVYLDEDKDKSGSIKGRIFNLPDFIKDGVYAVELIAVDVAGNESLLNLNTYARMTEQDVLAYTLESNLEEKTGLYSFQYENGDAISKRPDNFSDIKIFVLAKKDTDVDIVLRDNNAEEINTNAPFEEGDSVYGIGAYTFNLKSDYFKENFQDDTDIELHLTVKNQGNRIDLGKMHIDNIAPTCDLPEEFRSWHWYYGDSDRTITIANINEPIDVNLCKVYDNGKAIDFKYSDEDRSLVFTLAGGWHNVGIIIDDMAGNANNIQEKSNIHIGFFWLWFIVALSIGFIAVLAFVFIRNINRKHKAGLE